MLFIYSFTSVYLFIIEAGYLVSTSQDQHPQIAELTADVREVKANFATHISETKHELTRQKNWIMGGLIAILSTFLVLAVTIIVTLLVDIF